MEVILPLALALLFSCSDADSTPGPRGEPLNGPLRPSPGLLLVDYRALDEGPDGVAIVDADPSSPEFGQVLQRKELGEGVVPHHLYFDPAARNLWTTTLGPPYLFRLNLARSIDGVPLLGPAEPVDVGENQVAEDMWFTADGDEYYVTFLGGHGGPQDGSVGRFDARTDTLVEEIRHSPDTPLLWPHGISGDERRGILMVASNAPDDVSLGTGETVTAIDLDTFTPLRSWTVEAGSAPVEVMLLRGEGLPPHAIVTTMLGGDVWVAPWDEAAGTYGTFARAVEGDDQGVSWPLELYVKRSPEGEPELYVSFAQPGVVNVYGLDALPELPLRRTLPAAPGAHHLSFFESRGRLVMVVQNNLIALEGMDTGTLTAVDALTGEVLGVVDLPTTDAMLPESIESAWGSGHDLHH